MKVELRAENLTKAFRSRKVVEGVSFCVKTGEVVGLLGPNGAGKTTSFYMMVGMLSPDQGSVYMGEKNITPLPMYQRARHGISYLPQNSSIFRKMTVEENLLSVMEVSGVSRADRKELLEDLLQQFQIERIRGVLGVSLSGGERRRVEIARTLVRKPKFLLLDEPFAGVDPVTVGELQGILEKLKEDGLGVLITDHNVRETLQSCDRVYVVFQGRVLMHGLPEEVTQHPKVREAYLGERFVL